MKKLLSLALALALALSLAACGSTPASTSEPVSQSEEPAVVAGIEGWTPFAEKVTITVPVYDRGKEGYPAVDDNYWTKWVQKEFGDKYNVEVKYVAIPRTDVMTKYSMLIAGGETPTIMMEYDYPKVSQWAFDGAMQPIDLDAFAQVAPTYYGKMVENDQVKYSELDGETYFVLSERPYYNINYKYVQFVRMDWLREVGYDHVPVDYKEYSDAINKIIAAGLTDTAPMGLGIPTQAFIGNNHFRNFPADEAEWAQHASLATPNVSWEPTKEFLKRLNNEYNMGWYSSEFDLEKNTQGAASDQLQTDFINGKTYSYGGYIAANMDWLKAFYENNPEAELAVENVNRVVEPGVADVYQARSDNPFGMIVGFSSLASADQLKAAWMLMEWMLQDDVLFTMENGVEGVTYKMVDGLPVVDGDYRGEEMLNHNMNIDMTCLVHASKVVGTIEQTIAATSPKGLPQDFTEQIVGQYKLLEKEAEAGHVYPDPFFATAVESESEYAATLLSLYQVDYAKLVKAKPGEFDALYEKLSKEFLDAGYAEVIAERLAAYEDGKTTKLS